MTTSRVKTPISFKFPRHASNQMSENNSIVSQITPDNDKKLFEEFMSHKMSNFKTRLLKTLQEASANEEINADEELIVTDFLETSFTQLLSRTPNGHLWLVVIAATVLQPYYDAANDTYNIDKLIEQTLVEYKQLIDDIDALITSGTVDGGANVQIIDSAKKWFAFYEKHKDSDVAARLKNIAKPYCKMICELTRQ